jgi:vancomycin resistance protein VanJ
MSNPPSSSPDVMLTLEQKRWIKERVWVWCQRLVLASYLLAWLLPMLLFLLFRWVGEANPTTAFLLFLPPYLWFLPVALLSPIALLFHWKTPLILSFIATLVLLPLSGWRAAPPIEPLQPGDRPDAALVVLSNNRGQHGGHSLQPFKNFIAADVLIFQESAGRAARYLNDPDYAEFPYGDSIGEFTLLSRYPVLSTSLVSQPMDHGKKSFAARFELDWKGQRIAIYNVHLPSPREALSAMRRGSFLYGLPLPFERWAARRADVAGFWKRQLAMSTSLLERLTTEKLPFVLAGDFNAPHFGAIHRLLTQQLTDAHAEAGHGLGFTFPGETRNPLALGNPWLRIDYVFAGPGWQVDACWTEPERPSQHRAVAALLSLTQETKRAE